MSGWSHSEFPSFRVSRIDWTNEVMHIAGVVGHTLAPSLEKDGDVPGRFYACHAEKQLTAYFIAKHVFLPRDHYPNRDIQDSIERAEDKLADSSRSSTAKQLFDTEKALEKLESELFNADDRLLGDEYDGRKVLQLKSAVELTKREIEELNLCAEVKDIRKLQSKLEQLEQGKALHKRLIDMAHDSPPPSLKTAAIFISSPICDDCRKFKDGQFVV